MQNRRASFGWGTFSAAFHLTQRHVDIAGKGSSTSVLDIVLESLFFCVLQIFSHVAQKLPFLVCCVAHTVAVLECVVLLPHLQGPSCYTWCFDQESWFSLLSGIATNQQASGVAISVKELSRAETWACSSCLDKQRHLLCRFERQRWMDS